tara:strand:- start:440 stop:586 length:147 start_codon:yes stop_codon:yes gene_type:complete
MDEEQHPDEIVHDQLETAKSERKIKEEKDDIFWDNYSFWSAYKRGRYL